MTTQPRHRRPLLLLATGLTVGAAGLHLAVGDSIVLVAPVTYAAPWPLILIAALGLTGSHAYRRSWRLATLCLFVLSVAAWQWVGLWGTSPPPAPPGPECRLIFWNAASPKHPSRPLMEAVRDNHADLIVLAESGPAPPEGPWVYAQELPGYHLYEFPNEIMVISKGNATLRESRELPNQSTVRTVECESPVGPVALVLADLGSSPLADRRPMVSGVLAMAASYPDAIILGDFNTPYDSVTFNPFRERYTHALKAAHRGPIETWPTVAPCLAIDHVWLPPAFAVVSASKRWTRASDHAMLSVTFARR